MRKYDAQAPSPPGDVRLHHPEEEAEVDQRELPELPRLRPQPFNWPAEATATSGKRDIEGHPELRTKTLHPKIYGIPMEIHDSSPAFTMDFTHLTSGVQVISISRQGISIASPGAHQIQRPRVKGDLLSDASQASHGMVILQTAIRM